ncbi:MAG TPA: LPS export ABC transporter periplasmic protein LptC, partial [Armatimonadota bacterium]
KRGSPMPLYTRCRLMTTLLVVGVCVALLAGCPGHRQGKRPPNGTKPKTTGGQQAAAKKNTFTIHGPYNIVYPIKGPRVFIATVKSGVGEIIPGQEQRVDSTNFTLSGVDCQMYKGGASALHVTADSGKVLFKGKQVFVKLNGHVHAQEPVRGLQMDADTLQWTAEVDRITATRVIWRGNGFEHRADAGKFTTDLSQGNFTGNVKTDSVGLRR